MNLIWAILLFTIACITSLITLTRTRKVKIPQELLELENEIQRGFSRIKLRRLALAEIHYGRHFLETISPERIEVYYPEFAPTVRIIGPKERVEEVKAVLKAFRYYKPLLPAYLQSYGEEYE